MDEKKPTCGRCGVYKSLHPVDRCSGYRHSWWWDRHAVHLHVAAWFWIHALPSQARWTWAQRLTSRGIDWCGLVDSVMYADDWGKRSDPLARRQDYSGDWGCLCDFPLPWHVGPPRPGWCYCGPDVPGALRHEAKTA